MAIYQPTNIIPSSFSGIGNGVISADEPLSISWQVNGNSALQKFDIEIYDITEDDTAYYLTEEETGCPFWGTDEKGNSKPFTYSPENTTWGDAGIEDGHEYKLKITQYWSLIDNSKYVVQNSESYFIARTGPALSLASSDIAYGIIDKIKGTFTGTYTQAQGDSINYVRWTLSTVEDEFTVPVLLEDTGEISTGKIEYTYDGFMSGTNYILTCTVQTENGVEISAEMNFTAEYESQAGTSGIEMQLADDNSALLKFNGEGATIIPAKLSDDYDGEIANGELKIRKGTVWWQSVNGSSMHFIQPMAIAISLPKMDEGLSDFPAKIKIQGTDVTFYITRTPAQSLASIPYKLKLKCVCDYVPADEEIQGSFEHSFEYNTNYDNSVLVISPTYAKLYLLNSGRALQSTLTYNYDGTLDFSVISIYINRRLVGNNPSRIDYIYATKNLAYDFTQNNYTPSVAFDSDRLFYATFTTDYQAGYLPEDYINAELVIYRNDGKLSPIARVPKDTNQIKDYGIKSRTKYQYSAYFVVNDKYTDFAITENLFCAQFRAYTLIEATQDAEYPNTYHVLKTWLFGNNISDTSISNNNNPNFVENFTPYPLRQASSVTAKSGTLSALLSNFNNGKYADTSEQMDRLFEISASKNTFFLKDMKGNLYMVHTSAPISQTINTANAQQSVTISLPWQEVGDASDISLIQFPTDEGWDGDKIVVVPGGIVPTEKAEILLDLQRIIERQRYYIEQGDIESEEI